MPQMMPMKWMMILLMINFMLMMVISFIYYFKIPNPPNNINTLSLKFNNWTWKW